MRLFRRMIFVLAAAAIVASPAAARDQPRVPTIDDLLNINSIGGVRIAPNGRWVAYSVTHSDFKKDAFVTQVWIADPASGRKYQLTRGDKSAGDLSWSPDSTWLDSTRHRAGDATQNPDLIQVGTADLYILSLADDSVKKIVAQPGPDAKPHWSPDGKELVFESAMGNSHFFHCNRRLAVVPADGGKPRSLTDEFDDDPFL